MIRSNRWTRSQPRPIARSWTASLPAWKRPRTSTSAEGRLEQLAVLVDRVLAEMPGVVRLLGTLGREGQSVRGRDERQRSRRSRSRRAARNVLDVLDRLQEDDRVERSGDVLDQVALEAQVRAAVARRGMLVGLRVGVDPDDLGSRRGEHVRSRIPHRRRDRRRACPSTCRRDPLVDGEVAAVPVVLLGNVGKGPLAGQLQRRDAVGLIGLHVALFRLGGGGGHRAADGTVPRPCQRLPTPPPSGFGTSTPAITTSPPTPTTPSGESTSPQPGGAGAIEADARRSGPSPAAGSTRSRSEPEPVTSRST